MTDLIERLRQVVRAACVPYRVYDAVCAEAAAALEAQVKEVAAMRAEIAKLTYERDGWKREDEAECEENKRLLADNARLTVDRDGLASKLNEAIELLREAYTALRHPDTVLLEQRIYSALKEHHDREAIRFPLRCRD